VDAAQLAWRRAFVLDFALLGSEHGRCNRTGKHSSKCLFLPWESQPRWLGMLGAPGGTRPNPSPLTPLPKREGRWLRYLGGVGLFLAVVAYPLAPNPSIGQSPASVKKTAPVPRAVRVT